MSRDKTFNGLDLRLKLPQLLAAAQASTTWTGTLLDLLKGVPTARTFKTSTISLTNPKSGSNSCSAEYHLRSLVRRYRKWLLFLQCSNTFVRYSRPSHMRLPVVLLKHCCCWYHHHYSRNSRNNSNPDSQCSLPTRDTVVEQG